MIKIFKYFTLLSYSLLLAFPMEAFSNEASLPQLNLTYSGTLSKNMNNYIEASLTVEDTDGEISEYPNVLIKTRGATASAYNNKPALNLKLRDQEGNELDENLLGIRKASSFILDAMAIDRINMRNRVAFDIWNSFSRLPYETDFDSRNGTSGKFVEVFLNGKYRGIYCLSDKINRKLLDLKKPQIDEDTGEVTIRGVLYKNGTNDIADQTKPGFFNDYIDFVALYHDAWELHEPEEYACPEAWEPLQELYDSEHYLDYNYVKQHFYLENLADYTIHIMALCIQDNWGTKNRYFSIRNITKDDNNGRFIITPWDLDASLGGNYNGTKYGGNYTQWQISDIAKNPPIPLTACMGNSEFKTILRNRWIEGSISAFSVDALKRRLEEYADLFIESGAWERSVKAANPHDLIVKDLKEEISLIMDWYEKRFKEMDKYFGVSDNDREAFSMIRPLKEDYDHSTETIFNLQGIPVKNMDKPGLYIKNGKKIIVK